MTELDAEGVGPTAVGQGDAGVDAGAAEGGGGDDAVRVARIRCLDSLRARGFTFARGKVVEGVPLAHAEYLAAGGKAEILEVS